VRRRCRPCAVGRNHDPPLAQYLPEPRNRRGKPSINMARTKEWQTAYPDGCVAPAILRQWWVMVAPHTHMGRHRRAHLLQSRSTLLHPNSRQRPKDVAGSQARDGKGLSGGPCFMVAPQVCWRYRMR